MLGVMVSLESVLAVTLLGGLLIWSVWNWIRFRIVSSRANRAPSPTPSNRRGWTIGKARRYGIATNVFLSEAFAGSSKIFHTIWRVIYKVCLGLLILTLLITAGVYIANYMGAI